MINSAPNTLAGEIAGYYMVLGSKERKWSNAAI
jgi:hypothetical protein